MKDIISELRNLPGSIPLFVAPGMASPGVTPSAPEIAPENAPIDLSRPLWEQDELFLNPFEELPEVVTWCTMGERPALPKQGLITIDAKPKQGKSMCSYALSIPLLTGASFGSITPRDTPNLVIVFDTEMSKLSLLPRYRAIRATMGEAANRLLIVPLLGKRRSDFWDIIHSTISRYNPDIVVIDHISKFVTDLNSQTEATEVSKHLERIKALRSVIVVIHQNKSKEDNNMRGALGSVLNDDQCESYTATRKGCVFTLKPKSARDSNVDENSTPFDFCVTEDAGVISGFADASAIVEEARATKREEWRKNFQRIFGDDEELRYGEIVRRIRNQEELQPTGAENKVREARECGAIYKTSNDKNAPYRISGDEYNYIEI